MVLENALSMKVVIVYVVVVKYESSINMRNRDTCLWNLKSSEVHTRPVVFPKSF